MTPTFKKGSHHTNCSPEEEEINPTHAFNIMRVLWRRGTEGQKWGGGGVRKTEGRKREESERRTGRRKEKVLQERRKEPQEKKKRKGRKE